MSRPSAISLRVLAALFAALVLLVCSDGWLRHRRQAQRRLGSTLRPLVHPGLQVVPERVRRVRVQAGAGRHQWTYERRGGAWRYPALFDAYASSDHLEFLLSSLLTSRGTVVSTDPEALGRFGLEGPQVIGVALDDETGTPLLEVEIGRAAPGPRGGEAYVRRTSQDTILHLHADPRQALAGGLPPMLDPRVLPRALERRSIVRVDYESGHPLWPQSVHRVEAEAGAGGDRTMADLGPTYEWMATFGTRQDTCVNASVYAYLSFLSRLQYRAVVDPAGPDYRLGSGGSLRLTDEEGSTDVLEIGAPGGDDVYLRLRGAGLVYTLETARAGLLMPSPQLLLEPLPEPSPYDAAQPMGPQEPR